MHFRNDGKRHIRISYDKRKPYEEEKEDLL